MKRPHVKLFTSYGNKYCYDVNKNEIIELSHDEYLLIRRVINKKENGDNISSIDEKLKAWISKGYFSAQYPQKIEHPLTPYMKDYLTKRVQGITLQVTQNCNFRCRYCSFSGDGYFDRTHNGAMMSIDVAKSAINFLKKNSIDMAWIRVVFYGGEPLLNFPLIREVVKYAVMIMPEKTICYSMTTNASLITEEMIDFFAEHKFDLTISLDGPQNYHDRYRRFTADGTGTYSSVMSSLKKIYSMDAEYFKKHVSLSCVVDGDDDIGEIQKFFNSDFFEDTLVQFSTLDSSKNNYKRNPTEDFFNSYNENVFAALINNYLQNELVLEIPKTKKVLFSNSSDYDEFLDSLSRKTSIIKYHHSGPCIPGQAKMLVSTDGKIFTCEKASGKSTTMCIGDIYKGYDWNNIDALLNIGKITEEECKNCWAIRFGSVCAINIDNFDSLSKNIKLQECEITKRRIESIMKNHVVIKRIKELIEK